MKKRISVICMLAITLMCNSVYSSIPGDYDGDSAVNAYDFEVFSDCIAGPGLSVDPGCLTLDLDDDADVDLEDFSIFATHYGMIDCSLTSVSASSTESDVYLPENVLDGDFETRWASEWTENQWIMIDFGLQRNISGMAIYWQYAHATSYAIRVSNDGATWSTVYSTDAGNGDTDIIRFSPRNARYIKIDCIERSSEWGFSIFEIDVISNDKCYIPPHPLDELTGEERIAYIVDHMTLEEKAAFLYGASIMELRPIPRLRVPAFKMADGPLGCRHGQSTLFPAPIAMASTWDTDLVHQFGVAIGKEYSNQARQVWLGPGMNIIRVPQNGRNFEYYSEDPYLASRMAVASITGAQSQGVIACAKHYVANNQETDRNTVNVVANERTLREIYLPAFEAAVKEGGVLSIMAAYNKLNGLYCTANPWLLTDVLKNEWGFSGFVVSDWGAIHETAATANAGSDLEMDGNEPTGLFWGNDLLLNAIQSGQVSENRIDDMVARILRAMEFSGVLYETWPYQNEELVEHRPLVRKLAADGMVLLKNDNNVLPFDKNATQTIAVFGPNATIECRGGGGSSYVDNAHYAITAFQGLQNVAGSNTTFNLANSQTLPNDAAGIAINQSYLSHSGGSGNGLMGEYFNNMTLSGTAALTRVESSMEHRWGGGSPGSGINNDNFSARWTGTLTVPESGDWLVGMATDDGFKLYLDNELIAEDWSGHAVRLTTDLIHLEANHPYAIRAEYYEDAGDATAVLVCSPASEVLGDVASIAQNADKAILFVGLNSSVESEGYDRSSMELDSSQNLLIKTVAAANPNTAVVIIGGSQVGMESWIDDVPAVLEAWYGGQEAGNAFADVIFGDVNPGGKLPMTFVRNWNEHPANGLFPGGHYLDNLLVGYRYFDQSTTEPLFPFGFGLSYTTFSYSNLAVDTTHVSENGTVTVSFDVQNTGDRAGAEVAQVYVRDISSSVPRPVKELKGFSKVYLEPGQSSRVSIELNERAFSYWDVTRDGWYAEPGQFEILVGASSRDIRLNTTIEYP